MKLRFILYVIIAMMSALTALAQTPTATQATPTPVPPKVVYDGTGKPMVVKSVDSDNTITVGFAKAKKTTKKASQPLATTTPTATPATAATPAATPNLTNASQVGGSHWWDSPTFWLFFLFLLLVGLVAWWLYTQQRRQEMQHRQEERWHEREMAEITTNRNGQPGTPTAGTPTTVNVTLTINGIGQPTITAEAAVPPPIASTPEAATTTTDPMSGETPAKPEAGPADAAPIQPNDQSQNDGMK